MSGILKSNTIKITNMPLNTSTTDLDMLYNLMRREIKEWTCSNGMDRRKSEIVDYSRDFLDRESMGRREIRSVRASNVMINLNRLVRARYWRIAVRLKTYKKRHRKSHFFRNEIKYETETREDLREGLQYCSLTLCQHAKVGRKRFPLFHELPPQLASMPLFALHSISLEYLDIFNQQ